MGIANVCKGDQTKLITHATRMAACNTETILARALNGRYARADDEAYALIREALHASGDITIHGSVLQIRLDPLSAPRRTLALAALCEQLTTAATRYPGTQLLLRYEVKEHKDGYGWSSPRHRIGPARRPTGRRWPGTQRDRA